MICDAHVHLFRDGFPGRYGRACSGGDDLASYESFRRVHAIDRALVVGYEGEPACAGNNDYLASLAAEREWLFPLAFCPLAAPSIPRPPFAGIAVYLTTPAEADAFGTWPSELLDRLSASGSIVSVNATPDTLRRVTGTLRRLEGCRVLISHLGQPASCEVEPGRREVLDVLAPVLALATSAGTGVKLSGLYSISEPPHAYPHAVARPFVECLAERFGSERLYWGSDFSPALDYVSFEQTIHAVSDLAWSPSERSAVMGGNLRRLLSP